MTGGARGYCALPADQVPQGPLGARFVQGLGALNPLRGAFRGLGAFGAGAGRGGGRGRGRGCGRGRGGW